MDHLLQLLHETLGPTGGLDPSTTPKVRALMEAYTSQESDWYKYAHVDPSRYTRNLVDDGNGKFNLMILAWGGGQGSRIHDHAGAHCVMKLLDGRLEEIQYEWPDSSSSSSSSSSLSDPSQSSLQVLSKAVHGRDQVTYIHDRIGLHRVANVDKDRPAFSLHLYTPPYDRCHIFDETSGEAMDTGKQTFYSKGGHVCDE
ncbi:MAG: RmlC-like cupin domain-containing protein [Piptocephalis tieghemiana]|nr:MAG: RmlC-like cupin domain-containing protein [Piptocephalis tieghemiana]